MSATLNFLVQHRQGELDILLHPNSGCEIEVCVVPVGLVRSRDTIVVHLVN